MVDLDKLRTLTAEAIKKGKEAAERDAQIARDRDERKLRAAERKAAKVIDAIPDRAEREASVGRNHAIVMAVKYDDFFKHVFNRNDGKPDNLIGAPKLVWDYCVGACLKPSLEYWWSGDGMESGHNIVIHW